MFHVFQLAWRGCGGGRMQAALQSMDRIAAFVRAFSAPQGTPPPFPERLGFPKTGYHMRFPGAKTVEAVRKAAYDF